MSSKQEPLWRSLWKLISGEWIAEVRREREQAQREMIEAMPMPPCGDKHRHFHQIACAGYCVEQESTMSMADKLKLIAEWAPINHEGSRDIALFYSNSPRADWLWRCDVGNRHPYVMLGEVDGELTTFGDTPDEAVDKMLAKLQVDTRPQLGMKGE